MEVTIKLLTGRSAGREIKVPVSKFLIGRAEDCHMRPHSDLISRHHCVLLVEEGFCAIRDFGSRNGTFVNEEKVVGQRELRNGDRLKVAHLEFEVQLSSSVGGKRRPPVKDIKDVAQRTAAGPSTNDDEDITDWLMGDEEDAARETRGLNAVTSTRPVPESHTETTFLKGPTEETTSVKRLDEAEEKPKPTPAAAPPAAEAPGADTAKRLFGGGAGKGPAQQNGSKDSRDAAAQALKKFFNARKP